MTGASVWDTDDFDEDDAAGPVERSSWLPVDLGPVLDGTYNPPQPTVGARSDGVGLFYPGRVHSIASESEAGKTWVALVAALVELDRDHAVLYLDFEDDEGGVVGRLLTLGARPEDIRKRFTYIRPDSPVIEGGGRDVLREVLGDMRPTLCVLDGVTEAMSMHRLEMKDNTDVARFGKLLPRWVAALGPAVVMLDHVVKDRENRGRYAIGGVHKLNGVNGAAFVLENRKPFGIGVCGRSGVYVAKDRPGQLRRQALPGREGLHWFADLVIESHGEEFADGELTPPTAKTDTAGFRPTAVMAKVSAILAVSLKGLSKNGIEGQAGGRRDIVRAALELLINDGYVRVEKRGQTLIHFHEKAFVA